MRANFYDIESLSNVFTLCNFDPENDTVDVYYLVDNPDAIGINIPNLHRLIEDIVHEKNRNFTGRVLCYNLKTEDANRYLAMTFGLSDAPQVNDPGSLGNYPPEFRLVCDTDPGYDEDKHPYYMGYNSYNYDTTMLAMYFFEVFPMRQKSQNGWGSDLVPKFMPVKASVMRELNNDLFTDTFKENMPLRLTRDRQGNGLWTQTNYRDVRWRIRKNMLMSGRHVDVARLNEKSQHIGLKRLIGMLGGQILESEKLRTGQDTIYNLDEFLDLIAYNVSDCVNLKYKVFDHKAYKGQFILKRSLLQTYPELVYEKREDAYAPEISPKTVRRDRLFVDSSAAQLATKSLCPYGHLKDIPVVSYMYPSETKSKELGIPRVNVLEELKKFFYAKFPQPDVRAEFDKIYEFYKAIEGKNFNASENYREDYPNGEPCSNIGPLTKKDTCMCYYNADGTPSSCFVTFSIGGIHGAEYNRTLYEYDRAMYESESALMAKVQAIYPDPVDLKKAKKVEIMQDDGSVIEYPAMRFLKSGATMKKAFYKDLSSKEPKLFKLEDKGTTKLHPKYAFTSADPTNHEDFTSYYPNMLRMMSAFYNEGLGYDRYAEVFDNKQHYGFLMKEKNAHLSPENAEKYRHLREATGLPIDPFVISDEERGMYDILRDGTKLILNSASGAADANFESNIRMNNMIISMRCIGQMFSFRIGAAQTFEGARVTSTNTDGLFTVLAADINNPILERESADIGVEIEPEPTFLITKDSNNRLEMNPNTGEIERASGGTLSCHKGPNPSKALAHPAILDWALCEYIILAATGYKGLSMSSLFNKEIGMSILQSAKTKFDKVKLLNMFQNVIASSVGTVTYIFATKDGNRKQPIILQHYNRVFIMKDGTPGTVHLQQAAARVITPAMQKKRAKDQLKARQHDQVAVEVLSQNGVSIASIPAQKEAVVKKVSNIEDTWYMLVMNRDLAFLSDQELDEIIGNLDFDKYLLLLGGVFNKNWRNKMPGEKFEEDESDDDGDVIISTDAAETPERTPAEEATEGWPPPEESPFTSEEIPFPIKPAQARA